MLRPVASATAALEFDDVSFTYGRAPVLRQVSLCVYEGEFVAVVGANGSGKTTLMKLGLGLLRPTAGAVRLFGSDVGTFAEWGKVGYVPQRATATSALPVSVDEVVRSGLAGRARLFRRTTAEERQRLDHVVDLLGLTGGLRSRMSELSGGQQQRALIARALITAPRLLIMDEPTAGVDADARGVLRGSLEHLVSAEGMAVVYVSHDPEGFAGLAHRVAEVEGGRLRTAGQGDGPLAEAASTP
ncbi:MAG: ATP-binding cassette domain-containing protein [Actinomycetota bacterium]|nr:ATP-binding cassette domain-containing protein [Actinomycetota bacterium]